MDRKDSIIKPKDCGIYKITNLIDGKVLTGQTINFNKRWNRYKTELRHNRYSNLHIQRAWNRDGEQYFKFEPVFLCNIHDLDAAEIFFIQAYKSNDRRYGYNLELGGNAKRRISQETREKLSRAAKGRLLSEEHKKKISEAQKGKTRNKGSKHTAEAKVKMSLACKESYAKNPNRKIFSEEHKKHISESHIGRICSEETKRKMSIINSGRKMTDEQKRKLSEACKGRKFSEETRRKISEAQRGKIAWNKGIKHTEEAKINMSKAQRNRWANMSEDARKEFVEKYYKKQVAGKGIMSKEQRQKISQAVKKYYSENPIERQKITENLEKYYLTHPRDRLKAI